MKVEDGYIDPPNVWDRELSSDEVGRLYLSGFGKLNLYERFLAWLFPRQYPLLVDRKNNEK